MADSRIRGDVEGRLIRVRFFPKAELHTIGVSIWRLTRLKRFRYLPGIPGSDAIKDKMSTMSDKTSFKGQNVTYSAQKYAL